MSIAEFAEIDFSEIKRWLERDDRREIERVFKLKPKSLSAILNGRKRNMKVLRVAMEKSVERKQIFTHGMRKLKTT